MGLGSDERATLGTPRRELIDAGEVLSLVTQRSRFAASYRALFSLSVISQMS